MTDATGTTSTTDRSTLLDLIDSQQGVSNALMDGLHGKPRNTALRGAAALKLIEYRAVIDATAEVMADLTMEEKNANSLVLRALVAHAADLYEEIMNLTPPPCVECAHWKCQVCGTLKNYQHQSWQGRRTCLNCGSKKGRLTPTRHHTYRRYLEHLKVWMDRLDQ